MADGSTRTQVLKPRPEGPSPAQEPRRHAASRSAPSPSPKGIIRDYFETIVICVIFVIYSRAFAFQQSKIPTGSMESTLLVGDYIMVNRFAYAPAPTALERALLPIRDIHRHDVIVFKYPEEPEVDYIKRVVGLPGEKVEVRAGVVHINGRPLEEPFVQPRYRDMNSFWGPQVVPPDGYFVMGDHRNNSRDSRYWGFVPKHYIKGRAFIIWFSYDEDRDDWQKSGVARVKSLLDKMMHLATRTRWSRCFTLIR